MAIITLRPDGAEAQAYTPTPSTATVTQILAGTAVDDSRFIQRSDPKRTGSAIISFGSATINADQQVVRVQLRVRASTPNRNGNMGFAVGYQVGTGRSDFNKAYEFKGLNTVGEQECGWQTTAPGGVAWSSAVIDKLQMEIKDSATKSNNRGKVFLVYADVDVATQGTANITAPTLTVSDTARPTITWTWNENDGAAQSYYEARIYASSVVSSTGFTTLDTEAFPPVWESGIEASSILQARVGESLENDNYYAYVRAARSIANNPFWSPWDSQSFTVANTLPGTPTVTATHSTATGSVTVASALDALGTAYSSRTVEVQRSTDGSAWTVLEGDLAFGSAAGTASYVDYFAPRGGTAYYRTRQEAVVGDEVIVSAWGSATVDVVNDGKWWLKPVNSIANSIGSVNVTPGYEVSFEEQSEVYSPIGRAENVVVSAGLTGRSGGFDITTVGASEWENLEAVLEEVGPVYVEAPDGEAWNVRFLSRSWQTSGSVDNAVRSVTVDWVEV